MTISVGDTLPDMTFAVAGPSGPQEESTDSLFGGKTVVLFATPGAFTPTCSARHLPGFREHADAFAAKGVDRLVCLSVNDPFVMGAWAKDQDVGDSIVMLADGAGTFTKALGMELDMSARNFGLRSRRYALVAKNKVVSQLAVEAPGEFEVSRAEAILEGL